MSESFVQAAVARAAHITRRGRSAEELSTELNEVCRRSQDVLMLRRLLAEGASVSARNLYDACRRRDPSFAEILLAARADVDALDGNGCRALGVASQNGNLEVVRTLLKAGASIDLPGRRRQHLPVLGRHERPA